MSRKKYKSKRNRIKYVRRTKDVHHYWWPKALYSVNKLLTLEYNFHHDYHQFFLKYCKSGHSRLQRCEYCQFIEICCYHGLTTEYGKRLDQTEV